MCVWLALEAQVEWSVITIISFVVVLLLPLVANQAQHEQAIQDSLLFV